MTGVLEYLGITEEMSDKLLEELKPDSGIVIQSEMAKRIVEVAQGKPTNEVLFFGVVLALTLKIR